MIGFFKVTIDYMYFPPFKVTIDYVSVGEDNGAITYKKDTPNTRLEGKWTAILVCWVLGMGSLLSWNSMLTIGDYYYKIFPDYHPSRVLTLVYQPFVVGTMAILAYYESKVDTRKRNIAGYILFFVSTLMCIVLDLVTSGKGGVRPYIGLCVLVGAFGVADAHVQGGVVGDLSFMLPEFVQIQISQLLMVVNHQLKCKMVLRFPSKFCLLLLIFGKSLPTPVTRLMLFYGFLSNEGR